MNGSSVTLDKVEIQIAASAGTASQNISQLTETLSELRGSIKGGFNSLSKLAESLQKLKSASKNLNEVSDNLQSINTISNQLSSLTQISNPKGLEKTIDNLERLPSAFAKIDGKSLSNVVRVSNQLSDALTPLANKMAQISQGYSSINRLADRYGVSVTKIRDYTKQASGNTKIFSNTLSGLKNSIKSIQKSNETMFKNIIKGSSSIISKVKQIGLSLLGTRSIFTATRKAVSEYMQMDADLTWQISNNWKALGAQLAPLIENVIWLFKQFVRVIYSVVLALTGVDLIARANEKAMKGWGKAAKDTLGNLQKFDDLNVVEFPKASGDENQLIDLDPIDLSPIQKVIDWVRKLKKEIQDAWSSGEWKGVGEVLAEGLNAAIASINFDVMEEKIKSVAKKFGDFLEGIVDNFNWEMFGSQLTRQLSLIPRTISMFLDELPWENIGKGLEKFLQTFDFSTIINSVFGIILSLFDGVQKAFLEIKPETIAKKITDAIVSIFTNFEKFFDLIKWEKLGISIKETILNINWGEIFNQIIETLKSAIGGLGNFLDGLFGTTVFSKISEDINNIIDDIVLMGETIVNTLGENSQSGGVFKTIETIFSSISDLVNNIADMITQWVISDEFQSTLKVIEGILDFVLGVVNDTINLFSDWFNGEGGEQLEKTLELVTGILKDGLELILTILKPLWEIIKWLWENIVSPILTKVLEILNWFLGILKDIISFLKNVFKGDWKAAFEDIKNIASKVWEKIKDGFKNMINGWIGFFEKGINGIIDKLNWFIKKINSLLDNDLTKALGINVSIKEIGHVTLPKLETGTNDIPKDGPYYLHQHESVVPKKYNPALGNSSNEETNYKLDTLINILNNMDFTNIVNVGNETLYHQQQKFTRRQNDKYGTDINL